MPELPGTTVILTRAAADNASLRQLLRSLGALVIELPCVAVRPLADDILLRAALRALTERDRLVVTSRHGAEAVARALRREPLAAPIAVVGPATRAAAAALGLVPDLMASGPDAATLGRELPIPPGIVLLARSDRALPELPIQLRARGAVVREIVAYHTGAPAPADVERAREALATTGTIVCFASPSAVEGFVGIVGEALAREGLAVAFGARTAAHVRGRLGREPVIAASPDPEAVALAVQEIAPEVSHGRRH